MLYDREAEFRHVVSGRARGLLPSLARGLLRLAECPYTLVVRWRNRQFDRQLGVERVAAPVVSVGNLTLGGTGKTPLVEWICRWFRARDVRVAIVSRGYGAQRGGRNDEALELEQRLVDVPHLQNPDRVSAARTAIDELASQVIVLDDGFQHRRLARDLDIVLLDALEPFGHGHVFPRGLLREPIDSLARAQVVVLSRADMLDEVKRTRLREWVAQLAPQAAWVEARHAPREWLSSSGDREPVAAHASRRVAAFCGLGNPAGFRHTLEQLGLDVVAWRAFPDHYHYGRADIEQLIAWSVAARAEAVVCTHKDLVKIGLDRLGQTPLRALVIGSEFLAGQAAFEALLAQLKPLEDPLADE